MGWPRLCVLPVVAACGAVDASGSDGSGAGDAPVVVETLPSNGDLAVDASLTEVVVRFSEAMETNGWSWVTETGHEVPNVNGIPFYADETTAILPVQLEPDTSYALWVNSPDDERLRKFANVDGVSARAYRIRFHTR